MKNAELIKQIIASLTESLEVLEKAARASHVEATHESSRAESKHDMGIKQMLISPRSPWQNPYVNGWWGRFGVNAWIE